MSTDFCKKHSYRLKSAMLREINVQQITAKIAEALKSINYAAPDELTYALKQAEKKETAAIAKSTLQKLIENAQLAKSENIPICQDTGIVEVFVELGQEIHLVGGDMNSAINKGIETAYLELRKSVVGDPLQRTNTKTNTPGIIYTSIVPGDKLTINVLAKGAGSENKSTLKMFNPTATIQEIKQFVLQTVKNADAAACPPFIIGIGIGGSFDYCPLLAKKALLRKIGKIGTGNNNEQYQKIEHALLQEINTLGIGPAGYGGKTTALAVNIETYPCHIASLPVAVNMQCHVARHQEIII